MSIWVNSETTVVVQGLTGLIHQLENQLRMVGAGNVASQATCHRMTYVLVVHGEGMMSLAYRRQTRQGQKNCRRHQPDTIQFSIPHSGSTHACVCESKWHNDFVESITSIVEFLS